MAWTAPKTDWKTGDLVTAANLNTYLRDNLNVIGSHLTFSTWQPALAVVGTTAPTLGDGALGGVVRSGSYMRVGLATDGLVHGSCQIRFGTSGTAAGNGVYTVSLPVAMSSDDAVRQTVLGWGAVYDNSGADTRHVIAVQHSSAVCKLKYTSTGSAETWVTNAAPFAWAASDQIHLHLCYKVL